MELVLALAVAVALSSELFTSTSPNSGPGCLTYSQGSSGSGDATGSKLVSIASSSSSTIICRICQDVDKKENLKTLCQCTGSIAKYHVSCLEKWLSVSNTDICELCHEHFTTKRKPRPFKEVCLTFRDKFCFTHAKTLPLVAGLKTSRQQVVLAQLERSC